MRRKKSEKRKAINDHGENIYGMRRQYQRIIEAYHRNVKLAYGVMTASGIEAMSNQRNNEESMAASTRHGKA